MNTKVRIRGNYQNLHIRKEDEQMTSIGADSDNTTMEALSSFLKENGDIFIWKPMDISSIDPKFFYHKLAVNPSTKPVCQRMRKMAPKRLKEIERQVKELQEVRFIREIRYTTWLTNVVLVKKQNEKSRMCTRYSNLESTTHCGRLIFFVDLIVNVNLIFVS